MKRINLLERSLAFILALIMVIGLCPQYVYAEESPEEPHTHNYTDGICACGDSCTHAEYVNGICAVCGLAASAGESAPDSHSHIYPETYTDGKCTGCDEVCAHSAYTDGVCNDCHMACTHAEYVEGKCTVCGVAEPTDVPAPVYGNTTFVYSGSNESVSGANLVFYFTWGVSTNNSYPADCGVTVSASGNSVTLTVDKNTLTDSTVWLNAWDNVAWTTWNGISTTFSGETYYLTDSGVSTTPPASPDPEPHSHTYPENYTDGKCIGCGEVCTHTAYTDGVCNDCHMACAHAEYAEGKCTVCGMDEPADAPEPDIGTTTFVYAGSNETITADNLVAYITWGTENYNANAEDCGFTVIRSGNTLTLQVDKNILTDSVWMKIWDNVEWTTWDSINPNFSGETFYLTDNGVSTTPPASPDPEPHNHTYPENYTDGKCIGCGEVCAHTAYTDGACSDCHMACTHAEYVEGKCTVCGMDEPVDEPEAEYATATFVYAGSDATVTGADLHFYITWGTASYNQEAAACGFEVITDGNSATLKIDKTKLTATPVWMNIWEDNAWAKWDGHSAAFTGETYYIYDDQISTEAPSDSPEPHKHNYVEGICECGDVCAHAEYADGKCTVCGMDEPTSDPIIPEENLGRATFIYEGTNSNVTALNLTVYVTWGTANYNANAEDCGVTVIRNGNTVTLEVDKTTLTDTVWLKIWENQEWTTWDSISCTFSGETYHLQDGGTFTMDSEITDPEPDPDTTQYSFTVHCYGEGYQLGAWMALVEDGVEVAWTPSSPAKTAVLENPEDGWTSAVVTWEIADTFNRVGFQIGKELWSGNKYNYDFSGSSGEIWIIPDDPRVFTSKEAALEGMQTEYEAPYSFTIHCKGEGYQIGAWLELVENDTVTAWTPEEDGVTAVLENPEDGWTSVTISWDNVERYNRIGFNLGTTDPWSGTQYSYEFDDPTGEDIWIVPGYGGAYSTKEAALANAWSYYYQFKIHCYGEGYQVGAWMAKVENGEETAWTASGSSVIRSFINPQDGWATATVAWSTKNLYNRLGFQIGIESPWEGTKYSFDFTQKVDEIWILPDDPTVYLTEEAALEALNNPASAKYSFKIHCYGENYQIGAWLALVQHNEEVAWTPDGAAVTGVFEAAADGWSEVWVKWNLPDAYNRLGFTIGVDDPWSSESYTFDFKECPAELWIVPGDQNVYLTREEAEEAMTPGVEMTIPPETEPAETESAAETSEAQEESASNAPIIIVIGAGTAAGGGFIWWLLQFLKKRKK